MHPTFRRSFRWLSLLGSFVCGAWSVSSAPVALNSNLQIRLVMNTTDSSGAKSIRLAKDPRNNQLYYLKFNGDIFQVNLQTGSAASTSARIAGVSDHGISDSAQGLAIGTDGTIYFVGNTTTDGGNSTFARIMKGAPNGTGGRTWSMMARTDPYPRSKTYFDHVFNGLIVSPDGQHLYVNSGSRTDHGELQTTGGAFPNTRDVALTAKVFRLPAGASNLSLPNDLTALRNAGYVFVEGTRNCFDFAFAPNGDLFGAENGPDRDMSDELNWLRQGQHYGFPWRMGGTDNPQQFSNYDPTTDRLLDSRYTAVSGGYFKNDPTFPPPPTTFAEPVINVGPDADSFRDPADGSIKDASSLGLTLSTFTAHRSPLGLVFDTAGAMAAPFQNHGFVLGWTKGDPNGTTEVGPFKDASQDLLDLELTKLGDTNYQARVTRIVAGFSNPIDAEVIGNKIYVIEYAGEQGLWEVTFPAGEPGNAAPTISSLPDYTLDLLCRCTELIKVTVGDEPPNATPAADLKLTATSSNQTLVPNANIHLGGSDANRSIFIQAADNQEGEATITLTVTDQGPGPAKSASTSFKLTVVVNAAPTISSIPDQTIEKNTSTAALSFTVSDKETVAAGLAASASSDNPTLVPASGIVFAGTGSNRTVTVTPARDQIGTARITITVTDSGNKIASTSFTLTVIQPPIVKGDFNGDGKADLIFQHDDGFLGAWLMNGAEMSSASYLTPSHIGDMNYRIVGNGDFNGDKQEDLLFQHRDGTLAVWLMNGITFNSAALLSPSHPGDGNWRVAATADVNRDGQVDLVFQHTNGTLAVWYMTGLTLTSATLLDPSHPGDAQWKVVGTGDLNGDGKPDLIFQHVDGTLAAWLMDGAKLTTPMLLDPPHPGDKNWRVVATAQFGRPLLITLNGAAERPTPVTTAAAGSGRLTLAGRQLTFEINYSGLSGIATGAHLHGSATTEQAAGILINLAPFNGGAFGTSGVLKGTITLTDEQAALVRNGLTYANIHTDANPAGEIRGQVVADSARAGTVNLIFQHTDFTLAIWFLDGTKLKAAQLLNPSNSGATWRVVAPK